MRRVAVVSLLVLASGLAPSRTLAQGDPGKGKGSYEQLCTSCHGPGGKGDGAAAAALDPKPRDLTDKAYMSKVSDAQLFEVVKNGGAAAGKSPLMPAWGGALGDDQIRDLIVYVKSLAK